jgi:predicted aldo/keto reductase-like oxidoreductase
METRRLGRTGLEVSRIGFGGMTIPHVDKKQAVETVHKALDLGVNFIDTARAYGDGDSEDKIGEVMKTRRDESYLSSRSPKMDYEGMKGDIDKSLRTLGVDHIDLYEPHDVSRTSMYEKLMGQNGAIQALHEAKEAGKIRFIGVTGHNWGLMQKLLESDQFDAALVTYNIANREAEDTVIPVAKELDVGLFVMKVFGNSRLFDLSPVDDDRQPTVEECLRFALSNDDFPMILTGVKAPEEIEQNVAIANTYEPMTEAEQKQIRAFGDRLGRGYCYGCNYCQPCPADIDIPAILGLLDKQQRISWEWPQLRERYAQFEQTVDDCLDCEQCEEACPQDLPVRELLREAEERLGRPV